MKKFILTIITLFVMASAVFAEGVILQGGVSIDKVPKSLYGEWRVSASLISTNSPYTFKESSLDLWNLSRVGNVVTLENPFNGAKSSITINKAEGNLIKFKKIGNYDGKILSDVVQLTLSKDRFVGTNYLTIQTLSASKTLLKSERATYKIYGEKIAGSSIK
ncbi:hypothetical protein KBA27_00625 [bacterium]|nr:hypothetical protein [bacterium]